MDRSFLSQESVVRASRNYVCIRLATYEDAAEAKYVKALGAGRSGALENTVYCLLSPGAMKRLSSPNRGPRYRSPQAMASELNRVAAPYQSEDSDPQRTIPTMKNFELALNVAACDGLPLVVIRNQSKDGDSDQSVEQIVESLAWKPEIAGQFIYVRSNSFSELKPVIGANPESAIVIVAPGQFGLTGTVLAQFGANVNQDSLQKRLQTTAEEFETVPKNHRSHVQMGIQLGIDWESVVPETDPQSVRARQRARGSSNSDRN